MTVNVPAQMSFFVEGQVHICMLDAAPAETVPVGNGNHRSARAIPCQTQGYRKLLIFQV